MGISAEHHGDGTCAALLRKALTDLSAAPQCEERRSGHAPGLARCLVAAGHRQFAQMAEACEAFVVHLQQFSAPGAFIGAHADAVERQAEQPPRCAMLRRHGGDMRVVVLYGDGLQAAAACEVGGEARAVEIRMQIVGDDFRRDLQQLHHALRGFLQSAAGRRVVEVADMLGEEGFVAARQADGVLEEAADGEDGGAGARELDGLRREAAGAADELCACPLSHSLSPRGEGMGRANDAVVDTSHDFAVVDQVCVGDALQSFQRFVVVARDRLAARVGAGHDQSQPLRYGEPVGAGRPARRFVEKQVLDRRAWQQGAEFAQAGGNA